MGDHWVYREAYGDRSIAKMGLVYPLIEDDVSKAPSVDIHFKSMAMVNEICNTLSPRAVREEVLREKIL